jgi:hypothetical protein
VHRLDTRQQDPRAARGLETHHRPSDALDGAMVLLNDGVEILTLPHLDAGLMINVVTADGRSVGAALVDRDLLGRTVPTDRALKETASRSLVPVSGEQEVYLATITIDSSIENISSGHRP